MITLYFISENTFIPIQLHLLTYFIILHVAHRNDKFHLNILVSFCSQCNLSVVNHIDKDTMVA